MCIRDRDWSGPLAAVADSVARGIKLTCHREKFQGQYGEFRFAQPPFYFCQGMKADTFLSIALGKDDRAVWVERLWQAPNQQRTSHEALVRALSAHLGEGDMCPQSDDLAVRD